MFSIINGVLDMAEQFFEILRDYVLKERQKNPSVNETSLSKKMDIPPTTFNRLINGYSEPNPKTLSKLIQFIPKLEKSFPQEISKILAVTMERENKDYVENTMATLLSDKYLFLCWAMAFSKKGVRQEEIKTILGQSGLKALKTLEQNKIVEKSENSRYQVIEKSKDTILSFQVIKAHLIFLAEQYDPDNLSSNYIHYWVEFLNEKGKKELLKLHRELHRAVRRVMDNEKNKGDLPVFSIGCSDSLLRKELEEN